MLPDVVPVTLIVPFTATDDTDPRVTAAVTKDCDVNAGSEGTLEVAFEDKLSPGMSSGKHSDPSGIGYAYSVCDHEGFTVSSSSPSSVSICRSTSISTSLSSLTPVFKEPAPHSPFSS